MQPPTFAQPERRSLAIPILLALAFLAACLAIVHRATATSLTATLLHTEILPNRTVFQANSIVLGQQETSYTLFVVSTLKIDNHRAQPTSIDDLVLTLSDPSGAQATAQALRPQELANAELSFPKLKTLANAPLLLRETPIAPNQSAEGLAIFSVAVPQSVWETRKSATIAVTPYHLDPITLTIPVR